MIASEPFYFQRATSWLDSSSTIPGGASAGVTITAGASNAMGSTVAVLGPVAHDTHLICLAFSGFNEAGVAVHALADLLMDPAGGTSWDVVLAESLMVGFSWAITNGIGSPPVHLSFPIWAPAGASFGIRAQVSTGATYDGRVLAWSFGDPSRPAAWWAGRRVETTGVNRSTSKGAAITPGSSSSWSSWVNLGSPTAQRWRAMQISTNGTSATAIGGALAVEFGQGGVKAPFLPRFYASISTSEQQARYTPAAPTFCDVAAGAQWQARAAFSGATAQEANVALHGVY